MGSNGRQDPLVVLAADLARVMCRWRDNYNKYHVTNSYEVMHGEEVQFTCLQLLKERTGYSDRTLDDLFNARTKYVSLDRAEQVVTVGMRRPELFDTELHVVANPLWNQERWHRYMAERGCIDGDIAVG
jgi:hypothetical protein